MANEISTPDHLRPQATALPPSLQQSDWRMDFYHHPRGVVLRLLVASSILCSLATVESSSISGSSWLIDGRDHQYLRIQSPLQSDTVSVRDIGAAVSVLLGFAPPVGLSADASSKLNDILMPNPFDRPRAVLMLEVRGIDEFAIQSAHAMFGKALRARVSSDNDKADIQLPAEEVSVVSLDEGLASYSDERISKFASWLGGLYVVDPSEEWNGELNVPLPSGDSVTLHMSKKGDREFVKSLVALFHNGRRAMEMHKDLSEKAQRPAELLKGCFHGIMALQDQYGPEGGLVQQGQELLLTTLSKLLDSLQTVHGGQIVGVILLNGTPSTESETILNVMLSSRPSPRWLAEEKLSSTASNATIAEVALVRKTLAWITGIILLISTLLGIYLLLNMPLTRDTLLYSNVKLD